MIIKARHHFIIYPFFQCYTLIQLKRKFHSVEFVGEFEERNLPVLVISNHTTWWDGFWVVFLNLKKLHRTFHFMMLESQLQKHWYFNHAGGYSVRKGSRSIIETLQYTAELLQDPNNMVLIFPQGEIKSVHEQPVLFETGIERILNHCTNEVHILFVANLTEYFSHPKPTLFVHMETCHGTGHKTQDLQTTYNDFYQKAIEYQKNKLHS